MILDVLPGFMTARMNLR